MIEARVFTAKDLCDNIMAAVAGDGSTPVVIKYGSASARLPLIVQSIEPDEKGQVVIVVEA